MKKKLITKILSISVAGAVALTPAAAFGAQTEENAQTESTEAAEETKEVEDLKIKTETQELTVKNQTGYALTAGELEDAADETEDAKAEDTKTEDTAETTEKAQGKMLTVTGEDGTEHVFKNIDPDSWTEPVIYDEYGFLYIKYENKDKKEEEVAETAEEKEWGESLTMYLLSNVNVREKADKESKSLKVLSTGAEVKGIAVAPGWIKVQADDITGYVYHTYITENKEAADAKVKAEQEAKAQAEAAAAQAAAAQAAAAQAQQSQNNYDYSQDQGSYQEPAQSAPQAAPQEKYEVGRQQYDDCDGSGHGYYEITYSDGSVGYEEY